MDSMGTMRPGGGPSDDSSDMTGVGLTRDELEAAACWEADDQVPGRPAMTRFRQLMRYQQARWRETHGHPIGSQPIAPRPHDVGVRPVGSRLPLAYARTTGATFLTDAALAAAQA